MYNPNDPKLAEKYSSAVTLSDMEIFIFPELMFSLVLANIMSPLLWQWRSDPWFKNLDRMSPYRKIVRVKQFIMDHFDFNLDLDTWGLTTKEKELARFADFIDEEILAKSNALFGYEGDKYYFTMDIRKHFGLDQYTSNMIPYWKTETVEAMNAFKRKEGYSNGAGECVSLAALYYSALFVIARIPLEKIYMIATPLHSQNFVDIGDGVITNNRRIATKKMWFNGTELSAKARRALQNEQVTMVVNSTGYIHHIYDESTISETMYHSFSKKLSNFLQTDINFEIMANFLRHNRDLQQCFQIAHNYCGKSRYIEAEKAYHYEHGSNAKVGDPSQKNLLHEIGEDEFYPQPLPDRIRFDDIEAFFKENNISIKNTADIEKLKQQLKNKCPNFEKMVLKIIDFCKIEPRLPHENKEWISSHSIDLNLFSSRDDIIHYLESIRHTNLTADLAFMAYKDLARSPWSPFLKAAFERNPVCIESSRNMEVHEIVNRLQMMDNESIYDGTRMAQPDEVWNFSCGDGLEKAICLLSILKAHFPEQKTSLLYDNDKIYIEIEAKETYVFQSTKSINLPMDELETSLQQFN